MECAVETSDVSWILIVFFLLITPEVYPSIYLLNPLSIWAILFLLLQDKIVNAKNRMNSPHRRSGIDGRGSIVW